MEHTSVTLAHIARISVIFLGNMTENYSEYLQAKTEHIPTTNNYHKPKTKLKHSGRTRQRKSQQEQERNDGKRVDQYAVRLDSRANKNEFLPTTRPWGLQRKNIYSSRGTMTSSNYYDYRGGLQVGLVRSKTVQNHATLINCQELYPVRQAKSDGNHLQLLLADRDVYKIQKIGFRTNEKAQVGVQTSAKNALCETFKFII